MAICHFQVRTIKRSKGSRVISAAAYRSGSRLYDRGLRKTYDFTKKPNVIYSEIITPSPTVSTAWPDQTRLWNSVEETEKRKDAQLAREVIVAIPRELDQKQGIALVRSFIESAFVSNGMIADLNVHWDPGQDGVINPHAHIMLTMRRIIETSTKISFGPKVRAWNKLPLLLKWRQAWAEHINESLARENLSVWVDHRRNQDRGIALKPQRHLSLAAFGIDRRGQFSAEMETYRDTARQNGQILIAEPAIGLSAMTRQYATFTSNDLERFALYHSDSKIQFDQVLNALRQSPTLVTLGRDRRGVERYTSLDMLYVERRLDCAARVMARRHSHGVAPNFVAAAIADSWRKGLPLSKEQLFAVKCLTKAQGLSVLVGYAGAGKGVALGVAHSAWLAQGYRVQGAALSGIAAENLRESTSIPSRTLASLEHAWSRGRDLLGPRDILVIDEAGLIGSRQTQAVFEHIRHAGAKIVLVGDAEQLQAIEAGAAFRLISQNYGAVEVTEIRRQLDPWQAAATQALGDGRTGQALEAYFNAGQMHVHADALHAQRALVHDWSTDRANFPSQTQLLLAFGRKDVSMLNLLARNKLRDEGRLGPDYALRTLDGEHVFAVNDRVLFRRNARELDVKNGTPGTIAAIDGYLLTVALDCGRIVKFDLRTYIDLEYGYANSIHRAQGATVDRVYVLASKTMDRHATYVALSRHRHSVTVHYDKNSFSSYDDLVRGLSRERSKDMAMDYIDGSAARRNSVFARSNRADEKPVLIESTVDASCNVKFGGRGIKMILERYIAILIGTQRALGKGGSSTTLSRATIEQIPSRWPGSTRSLVRALAQDPRLSDWAAQGRADLVARAKLTRNDKHWNSSGHLDTRDRSR